MFEPGYQLLNLPAWNWNCVCVCFFPHTSMLLALHLCKNFHASMIKVFRVQCWFLAVMGQVYTSCPYQAGTSKAWVVFRSYASSWFSWYQEQYQFIYSGSAWNLPVCMKNWPKWSGNALLAVFELAIRGKERHSMWWEALLCLIGM